MTELGTPFPSNSDQKQLKKQKINVKMPHMNKKTISERWKFGTNKNLGLEGTLNGLGKPFGKKIQSEKLKKQ